MSDRDLGRDIHIAQFTLEGRACLACPGKTLQLTQDLIEAIEMDAQGLEPAIWFYPTPDGRGGLGFTLVQPITTSFITWDVWPDWNVAYLQITSCKPFDSLLVKWFLDWHFRVIETTNHRMGLGVADPAQHGGIL